MRIYGGLLRLSPDVCGVPGDKPSVKWVSVVGLCCLEGGSVVHASRALRSQPREPFSTPPPAPFPVYKSWWRNCRLRDEQESTARPRLAILYIVIYLLVQLYIFPPAMTRWIPTKKEKYGVGKSSNVFCVWLVEKLAEWTPRKFKGKDSEVGKHKVCGDFVGTCRGGNETLQPSRVSLTFNVFQIIDIYPPRRNAVFGCSEKLLV